MQTWGTLAGTLAATLAAAVGCTTCISLVFTIYASNASNDSGLMNTGLFGRRHTGGMVWLTQNGKR